MPGRDPEVIYINHRGFFQRTFKLEGVAQDMSAYTDASNNITFEFYEEGQTVLYSFNNYSDASNFDDSNLSTGVIVFKYTEETFDEATIFGTSDDVSRRYRCRVIQIDSTYPSPGRVNPETFEVEFRR